MKRNLLISVLGAWMATHGAAFGAEGRVNKIEFTPQGPKATLVISHSGEGKFRLFKSEVQGSVIVEAENLVLPPALTKLVDLSASKGPVVQMTPYNSQHNGHPMAKLVLQLRGHADVNSSDLPDRFIIELTKREGGAPVPAGVPPALTERDELKAREAAAIKLNETARRLVEVLSAPDSEKKYFGTKVTFEAKDADVPDIFRLVGESSGLNIIWDQDVEGAKTSLAVKDLPWDQLLDIVIQQKNFKADMVGNVVRIMTIDTYNRQAEAKTKELSLSGQLEPVIMAVIPLGFKAATDMKTLITDLLNDKAATMPTGSTTLSQDFVRGKVDVDDRTNSLVVTNTKDTIERIRRLVKELDVPVPQILIDSKIVIAQEQFTKNLGVSWQTAFLSPSGVAGVNAASNGATPPQFVSPPPPTGATAATSTYTPFVVSAPTGGGAFGASIGTVLGGNITALLSLAEADSLTKTIASPRVIVNNNKPANISDGQSIIIAPPPSTIGSAAPTTVTASLSLTVTPQVTSMGSVQLKNLTVTKNDLGATVGGQTSTTNKTISTDVLVDSGSTLVLGGIYQLTNQRGEQGIPVLKDLPFLGQLFRTNTRSDAKSELMVFITPQIIDPQAGSQAI